MEGIEAELNNKSIERIKQVVVEKPKKERTQAQKEAFEKARLKRAENLAKKKAEAQANLNAEDEYNDAEVEEPTQVQEPQPQPQPEPKPVPRRRGRPRKKKEEPPAPHFIPPTTGMPQNFYAVQGQQPSMMMPNGFPYWMYQPPPQKQEPVVNNYYYGTNPKEIRSEHKETIREPVRPPTPPAPVYSSSEEEVEFPEDPRLKYRFA
jgi:hypothetical protein